MPQAHPHEHWGEVCRHRSRRCHCRALCTRKESDCCSGVGFVGHADLVVEAGGRRQLSYHRIIWHAASRGVASTNLELENAKPMGILQEAEGIQTKTTKSGWWFGTCFIVPYYWECSSQLKNICQRGWNRQTEMLEERLAEHLDIDELLNDKDDDTISRCWGFKMMRSKCNNPFGGFTYHHLGILWKIILEYCGKSMKIH